MRISRLVDNPIYDLEDYPIHVDIDEFRGSVIRFLSDEDVLNIALGLDRKQMMLMLRCFIASQESDKIKDTLEAINFEWQISENSEEGIALEDVPSEDIPF